MARQNFLEAHPGCPMHITIVDSHTYSMTYGWFVCEAAKKLAEEGIDAAVIDPVTVKPLDTQLIRTYAARTGVLVTAENHNKIGGLYSAAKECLDGEAKVGYVAVEDTFGEVGPQDYLRTRFDLTDDHIVRVVKETMKKAGK